MTFAEAVEKLVKATGVSEEKAAQKLLELRWRKYVIKMLNANTLSERIH